MRKLRERRFYGGLILVVACIVWWAVSKNPPYIQAIATILLVAVTVVYVKLIYKSTLQSSNLRKEDRELDFKRRRLDEVHHWINEVLRLKVGYEVLQYGGAEELFRMKTEARLMVSNKEYIQNEAKLLDSEFKHLTNFENTIKRLIYILEHEAPKGLKDEPIKQELESICNGVLKDISVIKDALKL